MTKSLARAAALAPALLSLSVLAAAAAGAIGTGETSAGTVLTDASGMTLYTFDKDAAGVSNCYDGCAKNWPPAAAAAGDKAMGDYGVVERKDGTMQWSYKGMPLYTWIKDAAPGDITGDGVNGVWHLAKP